MTPPCSKDTWSSSSDAFESVESSRLIESLTYGKKYSNPVVVFIDTWESEDFAAVHVHILLLTSGISGEGGGDVFREKQK